MINYFFFSRQTPIHIKEEDVGSNLLMAKNGLGHRIKQEILDNSVDHTEVRDEDGSGDAVRDEDMLLDHFEESDPDERNSIPFDDSEKSREV